MRIRHALAMSAAMAAGAVGSLVLAQAPAQADPHCNAVVSELGDPYTRHASCASGAAWVRVKIYCRADAALKYYRYGNWVYSTSIGNSSSASCNYGDVVLGAWAEQ